MRKDIRREVRDELWAEAAATYEELAGRGAKIVESAGYKVWEALDEKRH